MTTSRPLLCGLIALLAAAAASCGGGEAPGARLAVADWTAQADAICAAGEREIAELGEPDSRDQDAVAAYMTRVVEVGDRQLSALRVLRPPVEAETDYQALLDITDKQVRVAGRVSDAADEGDASRVTELVGEAASLQARADAILSRYPFAVCGTASP